MRFLALKLVQEHWRRRVCWRLLHTTPCRYQDSEYRRTLKPVLRTPTVPQAAAERCRPRHVLPANKGLRARACMLFLHVRACVCMRAQACAAFLGVEGCLQVAAHATASPLALPQVEAARQGKRPHMRVHYVLYETQGYSACTAGPQSMQSSRAYPGWRGYVWVGENPLAQS
jgi:hypothetical protein